MRDGRHCRRLHAPGMSAAPSAGRPPSVARRKSWSVGPTRQSAPGHRCRRPCPAPASTLSAVAPSPRAVAVRPGHRPRQRGELRAGQRCRQLAAPAARHRHDRPRRAYHPPDPLSRPSLRRRSCRPAGPVVLQLDELYRLALAARPVDPGRRAPVCSRAGWPHATYSPPHLDRDPVRSAAGQLTRSGRRPARSRDRARGPSFSCARAGPVAWSAPGATPSRRLGGAHSRQKARDARNPRRNAKDGAGRVDVSGVPGRPCRRPSSRSRRPLPCYAASPPS